MPITCPSCGRLQYSRRRATCEFCGKPIPASQRLDPQRQAKLDRLKADEAKAHTEFMEREIRTDSSLNSTDLPFGF